MYCGHEENKEKGEGAEEGKSMPLCTFCGAQGGTGRVRERGRREEGCGEKLLKRGAEDGMHL